MSDEDKRALRGKFHQRMITGLEVKTDEEFHNEVIVVQMVKPFKPVVSLKLSLEITLTLRQVCDLDSLSVNCGYPTTDDRGQEPTPPAP